MMNLEEIQSAVDGICEIRNPTRMKTLDSETRFTDARFRKRVQEIDCLEADIADEKELKEVYAL